MWEGGGLATDGYGRPSRGRCRPQRRVCCGERGRWSAQPGPRCVTCVQYSLYSAGYSTLYSHPASGPPPHSPSVVSQPPSRDQPRTAHIKILQITKKYLTITKQSQSEADMTRLHQCEASIVTMGGNIYLTVTSLVLLHLVSSVRGNNINHTAPVLLQILQQKQFPVRFVPFNHSFKIMWTLIGNNLMKFKVYKSLRNFASWLATEQLETSGADTNCSHRQYLET